MEPYFSRDGVMIYNGDVRTVLRELPAESVHCVVTSPPYWALRDYGVAGQIGLEPTPEQYVAVMVEVFREVRRVLRQDGTLWLNLGDTYANVGKWGGKSGWRHTAEREGAAAFRKRRGTDCDPKRGNAAPGQPMASAGGLKKKDLVGIPWKVAFALQDDGWTLRRDIIWAKGNVMPESVKDRPSTSHEYIFLFSRGPRYFYDSDAISEPASEDTHARYARGRSDTHKYADGGPGNQTIAKSFDHMRSGGVNPKASEHKDSSARVKQNASFSAAVRDVVERRNKRSVWFVNSRPFKGAHFATFPAKLIEPCILAGCPAGGVVLDPFLGSGTTAKVSQDLGRRCIGIELNPKYCDLAKKRFKQRTLLA